MKQILVAISIILLLGALLAGCSEHYDATDVFLGDSEDEEIFLGDSEDEEIFLGDSEDEEIFLGDSEDEEIEEVMTYDEAEDEHLAEDIDGILIYEGDNIYYEVLGYRFHGIVERVRRFDINVRWTHISDLLNQRVTERESSYTIQLYGFEMDTCDWMYSGRVCVE